MNLTIEEVARYYVHPLHVAAALNHMSICDFKKIYHSLGIKRWPYHKNKKEQVSVGGFLNFQMVIAVSPPKPKCSPKKKSGSTKNNNPKPVKSLDLEIDNIHENLEFDDAINEIFGKYFEPKKNQK
jgi:hypothetical protein